jgi:hypothetical protein
LRTWIARYRLAEREQRLLVTPCLFSIAGKRLCRPQGQRSGRSPARNRTRQRLFLKALLPDPQAVIEAGEASPSDADRPVAEIEKLRADRRLEPRPLAEGVDYSSDRSQDLGMVEVMLPCGFGLDRSDHRGQPVSDALRPDGHRAAPSRRSSGRLAGYPARSGSKLGDTWPLGRLPVGHSQAGDEFHRFHRSQHADRVPDEALPAANRAPDALAVLGLVVVMMATAEPCRTCRPP